MQTSDDHVAEILRAARRIAIVGLGDNPRRPAYDVARYLQAAGYAIAPIHPRDRATLGVPVFPDLDAAAADGPIDIVNVFRRSSAIPGLVEPCVRAGPKLVWLQVGVRHDQSARRLQAAGIHVIQDRCLAVDHSALVGM